MQHVPEILKIIEGGLHSNIAQVNAYAEMLASKPDRDGMPQAALRIRKKLANPSAYNTVAPAKTQGGFAPVIPVDKDSRLSLGDLYYPILEKTKIHLPDDVGAAVEELLVFIQNARLLEEAGVGIAPSMLVYGPPGCGKTHLAHYIAAKLDLPLITARCDTLISSFLGSTSKNFRSLFDHAASRPCVLFLDEFDAFAKARDDQHEVGELKRVVVSLLQNIDALPKDTVLLAATNHANLLDEAVWRRFAYRVQVPLPNKEIRERLILEFLGSYKPKNIKLIIDVTEGMNGAVIQQICLSAIRHAILEGKPAVDNDRLITSLIRNQYTHIFNDQSLSDDGKIAKLKHADSKLFTAARLSMLFNMSTGKISSLTKNLE